MAPFKELAQVQNDGLAMHDVGAWAEEKYRLVELYASLFCRSMRAKWDCLVYIDTFAGPGYAQFRGTSRIVHASPMIVLGLPDQFHRYIFCEANAENASALHERCEREFPEANVSVIPDDANNSAAEIVRRIPRPSKSNKVLGFCFVDPFNMRNLKFSTIESLARTYMDFLVLIPSGMDLNRNEKPYMRDSSRTVEEFTGNPDWRQTWRAEKATGKKFEVFIVEEFGRSMSRLKYLIPSLEDAVVVRSDAKNLLLYRLMLYSKHSLASKFWRQARKYSTPQTGFGF